MTRKRAKSADQTSFGTPRMTEAAGALRKTACGFRGTPPSAIVYAVPEFIWGMSVETKDEPESLLLKTLTSLK